MLLLLAALSVPGPAAPEIPRPTRIELDEIWARRSQLQQAGMLTLGAWAAGNLTVGLIGDLGGQPDRPERYFHQMNWMWGAVNGVIAGFGIAGAFAEHRTGDGFLDRLHVARTTEYIFLFNGALDLAYLGVGAWMWERGLRTEEPVLEGYGMALIMQGGFLLLFDGIMFTLSHLLVTKPLDDLPIRLVPTPTGAAVAGTF